MTLLISMLDDDEIAVVMGTFGTNAPHGAHFTKCWSPPGGKFIVAGTGTAQIVAPWLAAIADNPDRSVSVVIAEAERMLPELWRHLSSEVGEDQLRPTTAWMYYFDPYSRANRIEVSSRSNFTRQSETRTGTLVIPQVPVGQFSNFGGTDPEFLRMARHVADYCSKQPAQVDNVAVRGQAVIIRLPMRGGAVTNRLGHLS